MIARLAALLLPIVGCAAHAQRVPTNAAMPARLSLRPAVDPDASDKQACGRLCSPDVSCGAQESDCLARCEGERARTKAGFIAAYARCAFPPGARCPEHDGCSEAAAKAFPRDEVNQRLMAVAVCRRGERCQGLGPVGREACIAATLHPHEAEQQAGAHLVDALRRERVEAFATCVDAAACPPMGASDATPERCYDRHVVGSTS